MMLLYTIYALVFLTFFMCFYLFLNIIYRNKKIINSRLFRISKDDSRNTEDVLNQPLFVRIIRPILDSVSKTILKVTPKEIVSGFEKRVVMAGSPFKFSVRDWINMQVAIILCLPLITLALSYYRNIEVRTILFASVIEIGLGLILPNLILSKKASDRQKKILNSLPDVIDLLTVSVEAGLSFDGALARVIEKMPGPLSVEFQNVLQEIKVGKQKKDALKDMTERVCIHDLTTFVGSVIQADQFGVSIGNVLRIQSEQMRQKRRQRAQEKAMKAPVKMLIPMVLFIFPTIFSVLIGPIIIKVIDVFMK